MSCDETYVLLDPPPYPAARFPTKTLKPTPPASSSAAAEQDDDYEAAAAAAAFTSADGVVRSHCFADENHPFPGDDEDDDDDDPKSRSKRKDRDELSDGGTAYCLKKSKSSTSAGGSGGGDFKKDREEWSDSAIGCLLDAYTDKYVQLNRGNLRGRDWEEVASIVSDRCEKSKSCKSVEQCKNKVDNLKKRYKAERYRLNTGSLSVSHWPWFKKMENIVGSNSSAKAGVFDEEKQGNQGNGGGGLAGNSAVNLQRTSKNQRFAVASPAPGGMQNNLKTTKALASPRWRRVVFRISGAALAGNGPQNVDPKVTSLIAREVAHANRLGVEVAIVVGGRNFFCGDSWVAATGLDRTSAYQIGMMATVMNSLLLQASLDNLGVQVRLQTAFTMTEIAEPYVRRRAIRHLEKGRVVIFGAGSGVPFFTTDAGAAMKAFDLNAEAVLKGTNLNGVYDCNSRNGANGALEHISFRELISRGLSATMDMNAITLCEENGIPVVVFNLLEPGNISRALCGEQVGTLIDQTGRIN